MAKEFVERETLLDVIRNNVAPMYYKDCLKCIAEAPAADVVEVVRCDDCERRYENDNGEYVCSYTECLCADDDFCSYGVRRDNDETD